MPFSNKSGYTLTSFFFRCDNPGLEDEFIPFEHTYVSKYGPISRMAKAKTRNSMPVQVTAVQVSGREMGQHKDHLSWFRYLRYVNNTVLRLSYLYDRNFFTSRMASLYWNDPLVPESVLMAWCWTTVFPLLKQYRYRSLALGQLRLTASLFNFTSSI